MPRIIFDEDRNITEKGRRNIAILEVLRRQGPISRPDISTRLGMNVVTISHYIDDFLKNNLVYEKQLDASEGGRRPILLDLNPKAAYAIGVGLNLTNIVGLLVDLKGNILTKAQVDRPKASVKEIAECLIEIIGKVLKRSKEYTDRIEGVGVGIAGLVNKNDGSVHWPERIGNRYSYASVNIPLKDLIEKEFNLTAIIENDATAACFGEQWLSLSPDIGNIIFMYSGVGCGIMLDGKVYTGAQGYAGEVAIHNQKEDHLFNCTPGNPCFLKRWEMDLGIVEELKNKLSKDKETASEILSLADEKIENIDLKIVFIAARLKNSLVQEALNMAAKRLGIKIAYLVNLLNPQVVIIGGGLEEAGEDFLNTVSQTVNNWAFKEVTKGLKIIYSKLRENASAQGAACLVMRSLFARV